MPRLPRPESGATAYLLLDSRVREGLLDLRFRDLGRALSRQLLDGLVRAGGGHVRHLNVEIALDPLLLRRLLLHGFPRLAYYGDDAQAKG